MNIFKLSLNISFYFLIIFFLSLILILFINIRKFKQKIKNKKNYNKIIKDIIFYTIIILTVTIFFFILTSNKVFFHYDETDVKYYNGIVNFIEYNFEEIYGTTNIGYLGILILFYKLFNLNNITSIFVFSKYFTLFLVLLIVIIITRNLDIILKNNKFKKFFITIILIIFLSYFPVLFSIYNFKITYFFVFISTLISTLIINILKEKISNKKLIKNKSNIIEIVLLSIILLSNIILGSYTRPEGLLLNIPFVIYFCYIIFKSFLKKSLKLSILIFFLIIFLIINSLIFFRLYTISNREEIKNENLFSYFNQNNSFDYHVLIVHFIFIIFLIFNKKYLILSIIIIIIFLISSRSIFSWDVNLFCMYFMIMLIPFIDTIQNKLKIKPIMFFIILLIILFTNIYFYNKIKYYTFLNNGKEVLNVYNKYKNDTIYYYDEHPNCLMDLVFRNTNVTTKNIINIQNLGDYILTLPEYYKYNSVFLLKSCNNISADNYKIIFNEEYNLTYNKAKLCKPIKIINLSSN